MLARTPHTTAIINTDWWRQAIKGWILKDISNYIKNLMQSFTLQKKKVCNSVTLLSLMQLSNKIKSAFFKIFCLLAIFQMTIITSR